MSSTVSCTTLKPAEFAEQVSIPGADCHRHCAVRVRCRLEPSEGGGTMVYEVTTSPGYLNYTTAEGLTLHAHPDSEFCEQWRHRFIVNLQISEIDWTNTRYDLATFIKGSFQSVSDEYHKDGEVESRTDHKKRENVWDSEKQELAVRFTTEYGMRQDEAPLMRLEFRVGQEHCQVGHGSENGTSGTDASEDRIKAEGGVEAAKATAKSEIDYTKWSKWM